jgi:hypothetical protein
MVLAGHYLPTLAKYILDKKKDSTDEATKLNLKGFMVGNPYTVRPFPLCPPLPSRLFFLPAHASRTPPYVWRLHSRPLRKPSHAD